MLGCLATLSVCRKDSGLSPARACWWPDVGYNRFTGWISTVTTGGTARFTPAGRRPTRSARDRGRAFRLHVPLSQYAAVAGAGPAAIQSRLHHRPGARRCCHRLRSSRPRRKCIGCRHKANSWQRRSSRAGRRSWCRTTRSRRCRCCATDPRDRRC
jgi:hypothetical protein